jgi:large subunit ribosomal protein L6
MYSFLLPSNVEVFQASGYVKRDGPFGTVIKKTGKSSFNVIVVPEGRRLFSSDLESTGLSQLFQIARGLSHGFRRRLSLTGIGFRAARRTEIPSDLYVKNFIGKRVTTFKTKDETYLRLKIGFSHEVVYKTTSPIRIETSRLEGRTKGTLISLKSNSLIALNQAAAEIRNFRTPDIYKGKGIYYARETIKLKKGKRQG